MGGKSDTPPVPDYTGLAQQQGQISSNLLNQQTASNRPNTTTPWGSTTWQAPTTPGGQWTGIEALNPTAQQTLDTQQNTDLARAGLQSQSTGLQSNLLNTAGASTFNPLDYSGVPGVQGGQYYNQKASDAVWDQFKRMELPLQEQQTEAQTSQLQGQGLRQGDAAYDTAQKNLMNTQYGQQQAAQDQAVLTGMQGGQLMQGMDVQAQQASLDKINTEKQGQLNLWNSLMNPGSAVTSPQQLSVPQSGVAQTPNLLQAMSDTYGAQLNSTNASNQASGNTAQGVGTMAVAAAFLF